MAAQRPLGHEAASSCQSTCAFQSAMWPQRPWRGRGWYRQACFKKTYKYCGFFLLWHKFHNNQAE